MTLRHRIRRFLRRFRRAPSAADIYARLAQPDLDRQARRDAITAHYENLPPYTREELENAPPEFAFPDTPAAIRRWHGGLAPPSEDTREGIARALSVSERLTHLDNPNPNTTEK